MNGPTEAPQQAARRLSASAIRDGYEPEALHAYTYPAGGVWYWRIRLKNPHTGEKWIRPMRLNGAGLELGEPDFPDGKPLYRLHDLTRQPHEPVIVVEGEWCTDALAKAGVLATTSGAADSAAKADWRPLAGRDVAIWPDNDEAGQRYAEAAAAALRALDCTVRVIDVAALGMGPKADAVDWLAAHTGATAACVAKLRCVEIRRDNTGGDPDWRAAVERLAKLSPMEYDRARQAKAQTLSVRVTTLDDEVKKLRTKAAGDETGSQGAAVLFKPLEPWPEPVDGAGLLDELAATFMRYVVLPKHSDVAMSLWIVFTHCIGDVGIAPILAISSPEKRCGKSTVLALLCRLVRRPLPSANITTAALFRAVEAWVPTLLIDEADTFIGRSDEMRGVLNCGHTRELAFTTRTVGEDHEPRTFSTWGAKAIALIGKLKDTLADRSIEIRLKRKLPRERVERLRHADPEPFWTLARKCARLAADRAEEIRAARPSVPEALHDRSADNWEPLLAIADLAGGRWPKRARAAALALSGCEDAEGDSVRVQLLADIRDVFEAKQCDRLPTVELIDTLIAMDERPWGEANRGKAITPRWLASRLRPFEILRGTKRSGDSTFKGYERDQFADTFKRYLTPLPLGFPLRMGHTVTT